MVRAVKIINTCFKKTAYCDIKINVQSIKKAPTSIKKVWELSEISSTATFAIIKSQHKLSTKTTQTTLAIPCKQIQPTVRNSSYETELPDITALHNYEVFNYVQHINGQINCKSICDKTIQ